MSKKLRRYMPVIARRYLTLDKYMSGEFIPMFFWTMVISVTIFVALYGLTYLFGRLIHDEAFSNRWTIGEAFIQLTNPSRDDKANVSSWEWIFIVLFNLFGLAVLNGVILTLLVNWISNRKDRHDKGEARYDYVFSRPHSVIIGGHKIVASLTRDLMSRGNVEYILIQTRRNPELIRKEVAAEINNDKLINRIVIYSGDRTSRHELKELRLDTAKEVYIIGESPKIDGTGHDSISMQTWKIINSICNRPIQERIPCHVMFEYQSSFSAFQLTDLNLEYCRSFRFIPFSIYENWAQQVLIDGRKDGESYYTPLDGSNGLPYSSGQRVHLIIVGMSKMGMSLAVEAAHLAHFPNFNNPHVGHPRTLITFIDRNAKREMLHFMGKFRELFKLARWRYVKAPDEIVPLDKKNWKIYDSSTDMSGRPAEDTYHWHDPMKDEKYDSPYFGDYLGENLIDIDFEFIEGDVALPSIQKYLADACADCSSVVKDVVKESSDIGTDASSKTTIAVCFPVDVEAISAALYFEPSVYDYVQQIWVQQSESGAMVEAIRSGSTGKDNAKFSVLRPFGMIEKCDYLSRINSLLPKIVAYAYECVGKENSLFEEYASSTLESLYEKINSNWLSISSKGGKSSMAKIWSNIYCANSFDAKRRAASIDLSMTDCLRDADMIRKLAEVEHNRWIIEQLLLGVRPLGREYADMIPIENKELKNILKSRNIHPDLISNDKLGSTKSYDEGIVRIIPLALSIVRKLNSYDGQ